MVTLFRGTRYTGFFCLALLAVLFISCNKSSHIRWVYYDETRCADKWAFTHNNEALKDNVISYMKSKNITIYELEIFNDRPAESCSECYCKSGRRIKCKIKKSDLKEIKKEGFYE